MMCGKQWTRFASGRRSKGKSNDPQAQVRRIPPVFAQDDPKTGKRRNLGTFATREAAEKHERAVQFFKRRELARFVHNPRFMQRKFFGTDGIRGRVDSPPITPDLVLKLGWAAGRTLVSQDGNEARRPARRPDRQGHADLGYLLEAALEAGLSACRRRRLPLRSAAHRRGSPYLTRALRLSAGIVISASHNPFDDNGMKFFSRQGAKLPEDVELAIERRMDEPLTCVSSAALGKARRVGRCRRPLRRVLHEHVPRGARPARHAHRRRLRQTA
jgi:phosphomannomutase